MKRLNLKLAAALMAAAGAAGAVATPAMAAEEQFVPLLVYRTGSFAPLGIPWADGKLDYLKLVNERDGGVNGVKITYEECETAYATDRGVECYERLKGKGTGASGFDTQSTGITFAVSDKAMVDKVPVETMATACRSRSTAACSSGTSRCWAPTGPRPT